MIGATIAVVGIPSSGGATFSRAADPPHSTVIVAPQHRITI
jgi:hypothetical protein